MAKTKGKVIASLPLAKIAVSIVILGLAGSTGYFFKKYNDLKNQSPEQIQQSKVDRTLAAVAKLYALPKDEKPDVLTVSDKESLKKQYPFFDQAENNDVVLIYKNAKVALLYRPSNNQLVKVGQVNTQPTVRVVGVQSERAKIEKILDDKKVARGDGVDPKTSITGIVVVDVKGDKAEQAKQLAGIVGGTVGPLPNGEKNPDNADLVVYAGAAAPATPASPAAELLP